MSDSCSSHSNCCHDHGSAAFEPLESARAAGATQTHAFRVAELDCAEEVGLIRGALANQTGILALRFDLLDRRVEVDVDDRAPEPREIERWIRRAGLTPQYLSDDSAPIDDALHRRRQRRATIALFIGGASNVLALAWMWFAHWRWPSLDLAPHGLLPAIEWVALPAVIGHVVAIVLCGAPLVPRAVAALRLRRADMNVLMVIAVVGAMFIGEWFEAGVVTWLFALALRLEQWSLGRARDAIGQLMQLAPPTARVQRENEAGVSKKSEVVPVEQVRVGERIEILPGDRVPLDSRVLQGASDLDLSSLTGESQPAVAKVGSELLAGGLNLTGSLVAEVQRVSKDSHLARVERSMRQAQQQRGVTERWVDRFAQWYTPTMAGIALLVAVIPALLAWRSWADSIHSALVLLVTACPCALVISTPVTVVAALTAAARRGLVLRGGDVLERLTEITSVVFDKTGTLTTGELQVARILPLADQDESTLLTLAASLEQHSQHPMSRALVNAWQTTHRDSAGNDSSLLHFESAGIVPGAGIESAESPALWIGNQRMADRHRVNLDSHALAADHAGSSVWLGRGSSVLGRIDFQDRVRPEAKTALDQLSALGVARTAVLSGDRTEVVQSLANQLKISQWFAALLPDDKRALIAQRREQADRVLMVGDGVNDAAALVEAHVGLAIGEGGTDIAQSAADGVLMRDSLTLIPWSLNHARRARSILFQNLGTAIVVKVIFFGLAISGYSSLWLAILADTGTSLLVIANALRALNSKELPGSDA